MASPSPIRIALRHAPPLSYAYAFSILFFSLVRARESSQPLYVQWRWRGHRVTRAGSHPNDRNLNAHSKTWLVHVVFFFFSFTHTFFLVLVATSSFLLLSFFLFHWLFKNTLVFTFYKDQHSEQVIPISFIHVFDT